MIKKKTDIARPSTNYYSIYQFIFNPCFSFIT